MPRRWPLAMAGVVGALLLLVLVVALLVPAESPRPRTLLSAVEAGASLAPVPGPSRPEGGQLGHDASLPAPGGEAKGQAREQLEDVARGEAKGAPPADEGREHRGGEPKLRPAGRRVPRPANPAEEPTGLLRSVPLGTAGVGLQVSRQLGSTGPPAPAPRPRGIPFGSHIQARLLTNLDSRTIANGPVEALLSVPHVARGHVLLPTRTMAYGTATESGGRFTIRFTRLRLPDDTEIHFEGIALARDDGKPGLAASGRIGQEPKRGEGLGTKVAKGTGNLLLDTVTGGLGHNIARSAGQTALNREEAPSGSGDWALLLDGGVAFDIFVEKSF